MGVSAAATKVQSKGAGESLQGLCLPGAAESSLRRLLADMFPLSALLANLSGHGEGMRFFSTKDNFDLTTPSFFVQAVYSEKINGMLHMECFITGGMGCWIHS